MVDEERGENWGGRADWKRRRGESTARKRERKREREREKERKREREKERKKDRREEDRRKEDRERTNESTSEKERVVSSHKTLTISVLELDPQVRPSRNRRGGPRLRRVQRSSSRRVHYVDPAAGFHHEQVLGLGGDGREVGVGGSEEGAGGGGGGGGNRGGAGGEGEGNGRHPGG